MKKNILFLFLLLFSLVTISAGATDDWADSVCCAKTIGPEGGYCQVTTQDQCNTTGIYTSFSPSADSGIPPKDFCDSWDTCKKGTCVYTLANAPEEGVCAQDSPKLKCTESSGTWFDSERDDTEGCKPGCCILGEQVSWVSEGVCEAQAKAKGNVDKVFRADVDSEGDCQKLATPQEMGACTWVNDDGFVACDMETKQACLADGHTPYPRTLCTAEGLSICNMTSNTKCKNDDVYFVDSCDNYANIWVKGKDSVQSYWNEIQAPGCKAKENSSEGCGNCDFNDNTKCGMLDGKNVCLGMGCMKGDTPVKNGESWCEWSAGAYNESININVMNAKFEDSDTREKLEQGYNAFNLPGSRYYLETCNDGEIVEEACLDYRNAICKEKITGTRANPYHQANCVVNNWRPCFDIDTKTKCEDVAYDCKWIPGDTFDWKVYEETEKEEKQGSCVPLYAPGLKFWSEDEDVIGAVSLLCQMGSSGRSPLYETHWLTSRNAKVAYYNTKKIATRCFNGGCFAIPDNRNLGVNQELPPEIEYDRSPHEDKDYYYKNFGVWVDSLQEKARSLGDCGYKTNINGEYGMNTSEQMTVQYKLLNQKYKETSSKKKITIYLGNTRLEYPRGITTPAFYWRENKWFKTLHKYFIK